jgi:hypothetical protein
VENIQENYHMGFTLRIPFCVCHSFFKWWVFLVCFVLWYCISVFTGDDDRMACSVFVSEKMEMGNCIRRGLAAKRAAGKGRVRIWQQ